MAAHLLLAVVDGLPSSVGIYSEGPQNLTTMGRMVFVELCSPHEHPTYSNAAARRELLTLDVAEALAEQRAVQSCWLVLADRMQANGVTLVSEQHHPDDLRELEVLRASLKMALRGKAAREAELEALCGLCSAPTDNDTAPDPYAQDVDGDDTPVVLCDRCYDERIQEI